MRTLNATLQAAMDSGNYSPIVRAAILDPDDFSVVQYLDVIHYVLHGIDLEIEFYDEFDNYTDMVSLERGAKVGNTEYTIFSAVYNLTRHYKVTKGRYICEGSMVAPEAVNLAGDGTYQQTIDAVMALGDNLATYKTPAAAWLSYQFLADGQSLFTSNIYAFFTLIKQKYLIHCCDNGINSILFFSAMDSLALASQYTLTLSDADTWSIQTDYRQFTWKDESKVLHTPGPASYPIHNLGYLESTASPPTIPSNVQQVNEVLMTVIPNLKYQSGDCVKFDPVIDGYTPVKSVLDVTEIFDARGIYKKKPAWYMELRPLSYFTNTEGGFIPTPIQYTSAFAQLVTSGFDNNLDASVTNMQLFADAVDDLDILLESENLSGLTDAAAARTNLGLGTMAVINDAPSDGSTYGRKNAAWAVAGAVAPVFLDGSSDVIQLRVQGHSTQTASLQTWETSTGTVAAGVDSSGRLFSRGNAGITSNTYIGGAGNITGTGTVNIAIGNLALERVTTGYGNVALGDEAVRINTTGNYNFGLGQYSLWNNKTGSNNVSIGGSSMYECANEIWCNTGIGSNTLRKVTGGHNTAIGYEAGRYLTSGASCVFLGDSAGYRQTTGTNLLIIDAPSAGARASAAVEAENAFLYGSMAAGGYLALNIGTTTANAVKETHRFQAYVSTAATGASAGFGPALTFYAESSVDTTYRQQGQFDFSWATATDATRKARSVWTIYDTAAREGMRIEAGGSAAMVGFLGAGAVVRQTGCTSQEEGYVAGGLDTEAEIISAFNTSNAAINLLRSALINYGLITDE